jgi:hypothetical protein
VPKLDTSKIIWDIIADENKVIPKHKCIQKRRIKGMLTDTERLKQELEKQIVDLKDKLSTLEHTVKKLEQSDKNRSYKDMIIKK